MRTDWAEVGEQDEPPLCACGGHYQGAACPKAAAPPPYAPRPLQVGQLVRLEGPEAAAWEVIRATAASATLKRRGERVRVTLTKPDGSPRTFEAWEGGGTLTVSRNAFVWAGEEAPREG